MKILYVVSRPLEINTSASIRNRATIEGLIELGHSVDLITTEFDKNHSNYDSGILNKNINVKYLKLGGIQDFAKFSRKFKVIRPVKTFIYSIMSKLEIYDNLKGIVNYASKMDVYDGKYNVIISSSDPKSSHLFVSKMFENKLVKNTPWIQIWGDPFLSDITRKNRLLNSKIKKEENRLLKYANKVIYVSSLTLKEQKKIYPNYAMKMFYEPIPYVKKVSYPTSNKNREILNFLYCGDYSSNVRNIKPLYDAIKNTKHNLIICGNSNVKLESTERIKIYPRVNFEKTKELESECDVLIHLSNLIGTQIPGKIYQYSGTNKAILFILDGEKDLLRETFDKYKRYIFCDNSKEDIIKSITNLQYSAMFRDVHPIETFEPCVIAQKILGEMEGAGSE